MEDWTSDIQIEVLIDHGGFNIKHVDGSSNRLERIEC